MTYKPDSAVTYIVVHYSATPIERDYTIADIDEMHRNRGFKEVGYHFFIRKDGTVETGRDLSQPGRFEMGAHSKGENSESLGVCYEGGVKAIAPNVGFDSRTPAQIKSMVSLILVLLERYPNAIVKGHRDMPGAATQCPGFDATRWWDGVMAERSMPTVAPLPTVEPLEPVARLPRRRERVSPLAQSTTITAQLKQWATSLAPFGIGAWSALQEQDPTTKAIVLGVLGLAAIYMLHLGRHIIKERLKKWADGDR